MAKSYYGMQDQGLNYQAMLVDAQEKLKEKDELIAQLQAEIEQLKNP